MIIRFKNYLGTYLAVKSENVYAFKSKDKDYDESGAIEIYAVTSFGEEIINAFFYCKNAVNGYNAAYTNASAYLDRISNLLTENAEYADVYSGGEIILSDGREL